MKNTNSTIASAPQSCQVDCSYTDLWSYFTNDTEDCTVFVDEFLPALLAKILNEEIKINLWPHNFNTFKVQGPLYTEELLLQLPENYLFVNQIDFYKNIRQLLEKQKRGEKGILITNGRSNTFFLKDKDEIFAVMLFWVEKSILWRRKNVWSVRAVNIAEHLPQEKFSTRLCWSLDSKVFLP